MTTGARKKGSTAKAKPTASSQKLVPARGRTRKSASQPVQEPVPEIPTTSSAVEPSQPITQRRSTRTIVATERADPQLVANLRPGLVDTTRAGVDATQESEDEPGLDDLRRQEGVDVDGDTEFEDPTPAPRRNCASAPQPITHVDSLSSEAMQAIGPAHGQAVFTHSPVAAAGSAGRLNQLRGQYRHTTPICASATPPTTLSSTPAVFLSAMPGVAPSPTAPPLVGTIPTNFLHHTPASVFGTALTTTDSHWAPQLHHGFGTPTAAHVPAAPTPPCGTKRASDEMVMAPLKRGKMEPAEAKRRKDAHNAARGSLADFKSNPEHYEIILKAHVLAKVKVFTELPYIPKLEQSAFVEEILNSALNELELPPEKMPMTRQISTFLRAVEPACRSTVKKSVIMVLQQSYNLRDGINSAEQAHNKTRAAYLLENSRFHYQDVDGQIGSFQHSCISKAINQALFSYGNAIGTLYPELFDPIPCELLALVCTAIHHCLDIWATHGKKSKAEFSSRASKQYNVYLNLVTEFESQSTGHRVSFARYRRRLFKSGMAYAGVPEAINDEPTPSSLDHSKMDQELALLQAAEGDDDEVEVEDPDGDDLNGELASGTNATSDASS